MIVMVEVGVIERCNGVVLEFVLCFDLIKGLGVDFVFYGCCMVLSEFLFLLECLCYVVMIL